MDKIMVSIDCITYNHEKYIAEAIESFLNQKTNFKYEILIYDDASTDRTPEIIKKYQQQYPDIIKPIFQHENQFSKGVKRISAKFNHPRARGKYIALCEGDDYWNDVNKLQEQVEYMESNLKCGMCFHAADIIHIGRGKIDEIRPYDNDCIAKTEDIILGDGGYIATNSILYRKDIMSNPPDFYINSFVGDYPLQIFTSTLEYAYYINKVMSVYRVGDEESWSNMNRDKNNTCEKFIETRKNVAKMLKEFNSYSNGKYSSTIEKKILRDEILILIKTKKINKIKESQYVEFYKNLTMLQKIKLYVQSYFPKSYLKLAQIKLKYKM